MEKNYNNIDDLFRDAFSDYSENPTPVVWQSLEKRLDKDKKRRVFPFRWFWYFSIVSFLTLLGASVSLMTSKDELKTVEKMIPQRVEQLAHRTPAQQDAVLDSRTNENTSIDDRDNEISSNRNNETKQSQKATTVLKKRHLQKTKKDIEPLLREEHLHKEESFPEAESEEGETANAPTVGTSVYSYDQFEQEGEEGITEADTLSSIPVKDGYELHARRKHNIVAAEMKPLPREHEPSNEESEWSATVVKQTGQPEKMKIANNEKAQIPVTAATGVDKLADAHQKIVDNEDTGNISGDRIGPDKGEKEVNMVAKHSNAQLELSHKEEIHVKPNKIELAESAMTAEAIEADVDSESIKASLVVSGRPIQARAGVEPPPPILFNPVLISRVECLSAVLSGVTPVPYRIKPIVIPVSTETAIVGNSSVAVAQPVANVAPEELQVSQTRLGVSSTSLRQATVPVIAPQGIEEAASVDSLDEGVAERTTDMQQQADVTSRDIVELFGATSPPYVINSRPAQPVTVKSSGGLSMLKTPGSATNKPGSSVSRGSLRAASGNSTLLSEEVGKEQVSKAVAVQAVKERNLAADISDGKPEHKSKEKSDAKDSTAEAASFTASRFTYGIKGGLEGSWKSAGASKAVLAPYLQFRLNDRLSLMTQPAIKLANAPKRAVGTADNYYSINQGTGEYKLLDSALLILVLTGDTVMRRNYTYTETFDSVVKTYSTGGTYFEIELPILLQYKLTNRLAVYGGLNTVFGRQLGIREETSTVKDVTATGYVSTVLPLNAPASLPNTTGVTYAGQALSTYTGVPYSSTQPGLMRMGYMLGVSYELKKRWSVDLLLQRCFTKTNVQGGYNLNSPLSMPYLRATIGYRLSK